jgi:hypothetical protein
VSLRPDNTVQTLAGRMGTGGVTMTLAAARPDHHHLPCALIPYTLKIRSGCEGGVRAL